MICLERLRYKYQYSSERSLKTDLVHRDLDQQDIINNSSIADSNVEWGIPLYYWDAV